MINQYQYNRMIKTNIRKIHNQTKLLDANHDLRYIFNIIYLYIGILNRGAN